MSFEVFSQQLKCYTFGGHGTPQMIKTNLLSLPFKTFNLHYEREFRPKISLGLSASYTPKRDFPLQSLYKDYIKHEKDLEVLENARYTSFSIRPDIRFYFGDHDTFTRFYSSVFLKYTRYKPELTIPYELVSNNTGDKYNIDIDIKGPLNTLSAGYGLGLQFHVTNNFYVDWNIISIHVGHSFGHLNGIPSESPIPLEIQEDINRQIASLEDVPIFKLSGHVNDTGVKVNSRGPIIGVSMGVSIGYRFK